MVLRSSSIRRPLLCRAVVTIFLIAMGVAVSAGTFTTFGPKTYVRRAGEPITVTDGFTVLNPNFSYTLRVTNSRIQKREDRDEQDRKDQDRSGDKNKAGSGGKGQYRGEDVKDRDRNLDRENGDGQVSRAIITINGVRVVDSDDFKGTVRVLNIPIKLLASNQIGVLVLGESGGTITVQIIGVDTHVPTITPIISPSPNAAGWNNTNVTVSFTCADLTSGIATCPGPQVVTTEGANQVVQGTAVNNAGNTATASVTLNIDKTAPAVNAVVTPGPNVNGWNNTNVTVSYTCTDVGSGIATCPPPQLVATEGANQVVSGTATDKAGNTASVSVALKIDKTPPTISVTSPPNGSTVSTPLVSIAGTVADNLSGVANVMCGSVQAVVTASTFTCPVTLVAGINSILTQATDVAGNTSTSNLTLTYALVPQVTITSPTSLAYLNITPTTVNGTVGDPTATVVVNGIPAPQSAGQFSVTVPLAEGPNILTATATTSLGAVATASITVTLDTTPPHVTITSPPDQFITTSAAVSVVGNVNDIVVGTVNSQQATVTINGAQSQVSNRTFLSANVPLNLGSNVIQAVATDHAGNAGTTQITVTRQAPRAQPQIQLISGNNQSGTIGTVLSAPLVVALSDASGNPVANQPVIFKVTQNNGMLSAGGTPAPSAIATTNAQGQAQVNWTLGMRSGAGGNAVEAYAVNFLGTAIFTATGNQGPPGIIVIDSGNAQIGAIGQPLPLPLIAVVVDSGSNRLAGVPVTFTVNAGGGSFGGQSTLTVTTDSDGRAAATLTLGMQEGNANNLIQADFPSDQSFPATFTASGRVAGSAANTTISGVVLDNSGVPIPGVTIRAALTNVLTSNPAITQTIPAVQTNAQGQFTIPQAPVGFVKLMVDGSTAILFGNYPSLEYDMVTVPGQNNTVGMPIYLVPLNAANQLCVTSTTGGGTLTIPEAPGFSLTFGPGQVTFPGGSQTGCVSVTVVHGDKVPMVPGFGQQPRFIVTIQPSGALFNPPASITLPNVDGLAPRSVTEMYSFDHDIGSFVAIGTGTVSDDGQVIRSNPGVGVLKAGWHCGGNPTATGTVADCPACNYCTGVTCVPDPLQTTCNSACIQGGVGLCQNGSCTGTPVNCSSGNPCLDDGCDPTTGCTHTVNQLCQNACSGQSQGGSCQVNGVSGTCGTDSNNNLQCQLCSSLGAGAACNSGGAVLGVCSADPTTGVLQCTGSGNQCSVACNGGTCVNGQCQNSCVGAPDGTSCTNGGTCQGGICTQCQVQIEAGSPFQNVNGAVASSALSLPAASFCPILLQLPVGSTLPLSVGTCAAGTCPLPSGIQWFLDQCAGPSASAFLSLVVQAGGNSAQLNLLSGSIGQQVGSVVLCKLVNNVLTEIDRKAVEVVGGGIGVRVSNKTYTSTGQGLTPLKLFESGVVNKSWPVPLSQLPKLTPPLPPTLVEIIPCPPTMDCAGLQESILGTWVESQPNPRICPPDRPCTMTCTAVFPQSGQSAFCDLAFDLDSSPPRISYTLNPSPSHYDTQGNKWLNLQDLGTLPGSVTASFSCSDPDDTPGTTDNVQTCPNALPIQVISDGKQQTFTSGPATDLPGNTSFSQVTLNIDTTLPTIPLPPSVSPSPNINGWNNSVVNVAFTATDTLSGINAGLSSIEIDGTRSPGLSATLSADGTYNVRAIAVDYAGNVQLSDIQVVKIDSVPPVIANITPAGGSTVSSTSVQIAGTVTDNASGIDPSSVSCTLALTTVLGSVSGSTFTCQPLSLQPGPNQVLVGAKDLAGNSRVVQITLNH